METVYIAGPMTGIEDFNYPAFNSAAEKLRAEGYIVENPAENKPPTCGTWQGYMRLSIQQIARCDIVVLLHAWRESKGARIEEQLARDIGLKTMMLHELI